MTSRLAHELTSLQRKIIFRLNNYGPADSRQLHKALADRDGPASVAAIALALNPLATDGPHGAALVNKTEVFDSECHREANGELHIKSSSTIIWSLTQAGARWVKKEMR